MRGQEKREENLRESLGERRKRAEKPLRETERVRTEELMRAKRDLGLALVEARTLEETLRLCFETAIRVSGMDCGGIYMVDEKSGNLHLAFHQGLHADFVRSVAHYDADSANARLVMRGEPVYTRHHELRLLLGEPEIREGLRAIAVIPVHYEDQVIACLNVASHGRDEVPLFSRTSLETIAGQIGGAIARSKMQQALRESEQRFRQIAETSPEAFWMISADLSKVVYIGPAYERIWGRTCESLYAQPPSWLAAVHPEDRERMVAKVREKAEGCTGPEKTHTEYRILRPDGEIRWIRSSASSILDERGEVCRLCGVAEDITELKRAEEAYRALVDHSLQGLLIVRESRILFANQAFADICGYTVDELLALSPEEVQALVHPDDQALVWGRHRDRL
ncbi:MAG: PAS domain-containing protein, partial [Thermodesulfobacteriota bacterium]|nr:PAS domain-containing protein [Thermodesulfobacteriota bacterium]